MKIKQTLQKIHDHSKIARCILYTLLYAVFSPLEKFRGLNLNCIQLLYMETKTSLNHDAPPATKPPVVRSASTKKCWNCKHRTQAFKVGKLTHYHCMSPTYEKQHEEGVAISPWETLRVFSDSCDEHELRS